MIRSINCFTDTRPKREGLIEPYDMMTYLTNICSSAMIRKTASWLQRGSLFFGTQD